MVDNSTLLGIAQRHENALNSSCSVLRYPGGKSRAVKTIKLYLPRGIKELCSPFLGGASVEISCSADGITVYGSDAFEPVINFWSYAIKNPILLSKYVRSHYPLSRCAFYDLQKDYFSLSCDLEKAAAFFVLNRSSFSGTTLSGGMSPGHKRFTLSAIDRLKNFRCSNLFTECMDYRVAFERHSDIFYILIHLMRMERSYTVIGVTCMMVLIMKNLQRY